MATSCITSVSAFRNCARRGSSSRRMAGLSTFWAPVATSRHVSEVEVSLSTVMALKLLSVASLSKGRKRRAGSAASVNTKASMVAISGAIMPDPLAMALMRIFCLPIFAVRVAPLANVSVVIMACAAPGQSDVCATPKLADFTAATSGAGSSVSPITPVEARNISVSSARKRLASALAVRPAARAPAVPVKALALPALTPSPRIRPPPASRF